MTADEVLELDGALPDAEAGDRLPSLGTTRLALGLAEAGTAADVAGDLRVGRPIGLALRSRAEAGVGLVLGQQSLDGRSVQVTALGLAVRTEGATRGLPRDLRPLVPSEAQPVQALEGG